MSKQVSFLFSAILTFLLNGVVAQKSFLPSLAQRNQSFGVQDKTSFLSPDKLYFPETWFHFIGGNVSKAGITTDLEAIAKAGISGIQLFHGQFGGPWPGVEEQITCLSPKWEDAVRHTAEECRRLGLRFTMLNCPGWATAGGPWIDSTNSMRHLAMSRTDVKGGTVIQTTLPIPDPNEASWRNYQDIAVLAFPTPLDDTGEPLIAAAVKSNSELVTADLVNKKLQQPIRLTPSQTDNPYWIEVSFPKATIVRSIEFPSINSINHQQCHEPSIAIKIEALLPGGKSQEILRTEMPQANSQDNQPITFACSEVKGAATYRVSISNKYNMAFSSLRFFSAARKNSWESEAGWTLRALERAGADPKQSQNAFINPDRIVDITKAMDSTGALQWKAPAGAWTILRIGHVNTGQRNGPAPPEGTGWECNKLSKAGADAQFKSYIGRLISNSGPLDNDLLNGMLIDSWECSTQTWTDNMATEFEQQTNYPLLKWLPAVFGYVIRDHETTTTFLRDWRSTINHLFVNNFYGEMAKLSHEKGLAITYETAAGDVFPADILEYYKYADVPMCEFWQPMTDGFVGSANFKPIKPASSATRLYGKSRLAAEAFTSFDLTWDEHFAMLKEVANVNSAAGVTHLVFHTYTHNPQQPFLPPGTSFGFGIGTPFLRGQTWWKFMPAFNQYLARCSYLLERGNPVSDVLWYLGDEINHKPNQKAAFPAGYKYDYCNPDILLNRLSVKDGKIVTPEGISYEVLWIPDALRMLPQTLEKIYSLVADGATVVGNRPERLATLSGGTSAKQRFEKAIVNIWGRTQERGIRKVGKGKVIAGISLDEALAKLNIVPDVSGGNALWVHRRVEGADWYFVSAPKNGGFKGTLDFRAIGEVELWDPINGSVKTIESFRSGDRTSVTVALERAGSCFIVFNRNKVEEQNNFKVPQNTAALSSSILLSEPWQLRFPSGWGAPPTLNLHELKPWKDLDISTEGKAFSGTATYSTTFNIEDNTSKNRYILDLGNVNMVAVVSVNGNQFEPLWSLPYRLDITDAIRAGKNTLSIEVTSTWFNRLVYDAGQPEPIRKTWTIKGPDKDAPLRESGLIGPVKILIQNVDLNAL
ncbi:MAG: hypothetical protein KF862_17770 [Chitinophagaceae bacterium]|nr:hypothetical protein [Chitinophagaceae bacterium]